jgi:lysophospholipase L1-like esterase/dienelactone hydrolase
MKLLTALLTACVLLATPKAASAQVLQSLPRVVELKASDGTPLKATYFAAAKPGPGVLLLHQSNRTRKAWDELAGQLASAGINTLTLDMRGFGESGTPYTQLTEAQRAQVGIMWPGDVDIAFQYLVSQPGVKRNVIGVGGAGWFGVLHSVGLARQHPGEVKSLALLSGETLQDGLQFLRQASQLPGLFVVADDDEYPPTVEAMELLYITASNPGKKFVHYSAAHEAPWVWYETTDAGKVAATGGHGTDLLKTHRDLPGIIVDWFVTTLIKTPGHAPADTVASSAVLNQIRAPGGVAQVTQQLMEARRKDPQVQLWPEITLDIIGGDHVRAGEIKEAIEIFGLNLLAYPDSADAQGNLADAYLKDGQKDLAKRFAERGLALLDSHTAPASSWSDTEERRGVVRNGLQDVLHSAEASKTWITTWTASPEWADPDPSEPLLNIDNQTVRERVRVSIGGMRLRVQMSNEYGTAPLRIGASTVALPDSREGVKPGSIHTLTFQGHPAVTIPVGATVLSDAADFPVAAGTELTLSLYFPDRIAAATFHELALKRAEISPRGDYTHSAKVGAGATSRALISVSAVLVPARPSQRLVVMFGDSIVDGYGSTFAADHNWPNDLFRRLQKAPGYSNVAVVNSGVSGNRLMSNGFAAGAGFGAGFGLSAIARFDRDALSLPGVTHVVLFEGINDIGFPGAKLGERYLADPTGLPTLNDITNAYRELISRAHAHDIKLIGATLTPFEGVDVPGYYTESKEIARLAVNKWIRTSGSFDGVIDLDAVLRDPDHPSRLLPRYASKDQLHPNDLGYQAMTDAIDPTLLK